MYNKFDKCKTYQFDSTFEIKITLATQDIWYIVEKHFEFEAKILHINLTGRFERSQSYKEILFKDKQTGLRS